MKKFNINQDMYIQIWQSGWDHLRKTAGADYIEHCIMPHKVIINGETWYKLQCHQAFHLLPVTYGSQILFSSNVMFDKKDLKKVKI